MSEATWTDDADGHRLHACACALVGDAEEALALLRRAAEAGYIWSHHVMPDADLRSVWDHPVFVSLREAHGVGN